MTQPLLTATEGASLPDAQLRIEVERLEEPLSPELALIDPVLAARARAVLPDRPAFPSVLAVAETTTQDEIRALAADLAAAITELREAIQRTYPEPAAVDPRGRRRPLRRRRAIRVAVALVATAVVAAGFGAARDVPSHGAMPVHTQMAMIRGETAPAPRAAVLGSRHSLEREQTGTSVSRTAGNVGHPRPEGSRPQEETEQHEKNADRSAMSVAAFNAHTFSWAPISSATSYEFELFKGSARIFEARSSLPRLTLPAAWVHGSRRLGLIPATYRWLVRPVLGRKPGARLGAPIVDARLVVGR